MTSHNEPIYEYIKGKGWQVVRATEKFYLVSRRPFEGELFSYTWNTNQLFSDGSRPLWDRWINFGKDIYKVYSEREWGHMVDAPGIIFVIYVPL